MTNVRIKYGQGHQNSNTASRSLYYVTGVVNWHTNSRPNLFRPPADVFETEDRIVVRVEIAGMHEGEFVLNFDQGVLLVSGVRPEVPEKRAFHQMEIYFGEFLTEVEIPVPIDIEKIEAIYQDGFLRVNLPKAHPRQIKISSE